MPQIVALKFAPADFPICYLPGPVADLNVQDFCIALREGEEDVGFVSALETWASAQLPPERELPALIRRATENEIQRWWEEKAFERRATVICKEKVVQQNLPMKISSVHYTAKSNKITFNFTSDKRVDFRQLVRDLAAALRCRIELWQIGAREEARMQDGCGICGLRTCCTAWLQDFKPVSLRMAKDQDIDLPPGKLTGQCGRLLCCLAYELEAYRELSRDSLPRGATVTHSAGRGVVVDRNLVRRVYLVSDENGKISPVPFSAIQNYSLPEQMKSMGGGGGRGMGRNGREGAGHAPGGYDEENGACDADEEAAENGNGLGNGKGCPSCPRQRGEKNRQFGGRGDRDRDREGRGANGMNVANRPASASRAEGANEAGQEPCESDFSENDWPEDDSRENPARGPREPARRGPERNSPSAEESASSNDDLNEEGPDRPTPSPKPRNRRFRRRSEPSGPGKSPE